ncbi:MAG TPA: hypothetical protein DCW72_10165 [Elusimicrobia bacterium]|nr:MAG: hypothetical protein A2X29_05280 [Elusimicrobia bacterium GWA2_64_40]HAN04129.1 hypothetical protein [Elusimicrobiota bacterium]HAU90545.1 hypothetical protein [Elusimicrobiota bacterium]
MEKRKKQVLGLSQEQRQSQDLRLFSVLAAPEADFLRQAAELEADPLFTRLCAAGPDGAAPVIRRRLPGASYAFSYACGDAALASAAEAGGAGEWLADRPAMLELARRAGQANFEKFFLSASVFDPAAAGRACGFTAAEASALKNFSDAFTLAHERVPPRALPALYLRCAAVVTAENGKLTAAYTHPGYVRGVYRIDRRALAALVRSGDISGAEASRASSLLSRAQRLAWRKAGFHKVLTAILEAQAGYLLRESGLKPLTQRQIAARAGLNPATVSRLIAGKSILLPRGEETAIKGLFLSRNAYIIDRIREILGAGSREMTDSEITEALRTTYGVRVSRRSVNLYRAKL